MDAKQRYCTAISWVFTQYKHEGKGQPIYCVTCAFPPYRLTRSLQPRPLSPARTTSFSCWSSDHGWGEFRRIKIQHCAARKWLHESTFWACRINAESQKNTCEIWWSKVASAWIHQWVLTGELWFFSCFFAMKRFARASGVRFGMDSGVTQHIDNYWRVRGKSKNSALGMLKTKSGCRGSPLIWCSVNYRLTQNRTGWQCVNTSFVSNARVIMSFLCTVTRVVNNQSFDIITINVTNTTKCTQYKTRINPNFEEQPRNKRLVSKHHIRPLQWSNCPFYTSRAFMPHSTRPRNTLPHATRPRTSAFACTHFIVTRNVITTKSCNITNCNITNCTKLHEYTKLQYTKLHE